MTDRICKGPGCKNPVMYPNPRARFCCGECAGNHIVGFFKSLKHTKGKWGGKPFVLEPWQENDIIRPVFGTLNDDGLRQYRIVYIEVPCKNGKSELSAPVALYLACADGEVGAHVAGAASDKKQARIIHRVAERMIAQDEGLKERCNIYRAERRIEYLPTDGMYDVLAADGFRNEGWDLNGVVFDELHTQSDRLLYDTLRDRMSAREQPLFWMTTTAGTDRQSVCWEVHEYALKIIKGIVHNPAFFAYIKAAPENADFTDERVWFDCNPALGVFKSLDEMKAKAKEAIEIPARQNAFRRYQMNQWTHAEISLIDMTAWMSCDKAVNPTRLMGRECYAGLDLAEKIDLAAIALCFPGDDEYEWLWWYWYPEDNILERGRKMHAPLYDWSQEGWLKLTPGNVMDFKMIQNDIAELGEMFSIKEIGYDPWKATQISTRLEEDNGFKMTLLRQGHLTLSEPTTEMLRLVRGGKFHHGNHPITTWMASNVVGRFDANNNVIPDRKKSQQKIDGIMAAVMALECAIQAKKEDGPSMYDNPAWAVAAHA